MDHLGGHWTYFEFPLVHKVGFDDRLCLSRVLFFTFWALGTISGHCAHLNKTKSGQNCLKLLEL